MADVLSSRREPSCSHYARLAWGVAALVWGVAGCAELLDIPSSPRLVAEAAVPDAAVAQSAQDGCGLESGCGAPLAGALCSGDAGCSTAEGCPNGGCDPSCDAGHASADCVELVVTGPACGSDAECPNGASCALGACVSAGCDDGIENLSETDVDCGGNCPSRCSIGRACAADADCTAGLVCPDLTRRCSPLTCGDGLQNGSEISVDCGGGVCLGCAAGTPCVNALDCVSGVCAGAGCATQSTLCCQDVCLSVNGLVDAGESDVDCGGPNGACARCVEGQACRAAEDCATSSCSAGRCTACSNGARSGSETDVDCGGSCPTCEAGQGCELDSDCAQGVCEAGRCCGGTLADCTRCARRLSEDNNCSLLGELEGRQTCNDFLQCLADNVETCPRRLAPGCSNLPDDVCDNRNFGGNGSPGVMLADRVLGSAGCSF